MLISRGQLNVIMVLKRQKASRLQFINTQFTNVSTIFAAVIMKKIEISRKLLNVTDKADLKELKSAYRNLMKEYHPDKIQDNEEEKKAAEEKSKRMIEAYHFLVSINPETIQESKEQYLETINNAGIQDFSYKSETLRIDFSDGNSYEYFAVPKKVYTNLVNAPSQARFARRHICTTFTYRSLSKLVAD